MTLTLNGEVTTYPIGEAVIDIGISDMLLTLQNQPTSGQLLTGMVTVSLLGSNGTFTLVILLSPTPISAESNVTNSSVNPFMPAPN